MFAWLRTWLFPRPVFDHAHGWIVLFDDRPVLQLSYHGPSDPWNQFTFEVLDESCPIDYLLRSSSRAPDTRVTFRNRQTAEVVTDEMFWTSWQDQNDPDGRPLVGIRDFRGLD